MLQGLNSWNDAGCYCDGVQTIMDDPETPKAYAELAAVLTPACQVEKVTDPTHRKGAAAPGAAAQPAAATPPASSTLAFVTTTARENWGRSTDPSRRTSGTR